MITKQQSKPVIIKNKNRQTLSSIEKKLLACCENHQHVLLYGKDTHRREDLIKRIHLLNGGIDASWEYQGDEDNINSAEDVYDARIKALEDQDTEKAKGILLDCTHTDKTWRRVNCDFESGKEVFDILGKFELFTRRGPAILEHTTKEGKVRELYEQFITLYTFLNCAGLVFVDNLRCTRSNSEDEKWYSKLAQKITPQKSGWLVVYAYDYTTFPQQFLDSFELVSLDGEVAGVEKATYLWQGEYPDDSFYAIVKGKKGKIGLSVGTQQYKFIDALYGDVKPQKASIKELINKCKIKSCSVNKKGNLHKVKSLANIALLAFGEDCIKWDKKTNHYYLDIDCRYEKQLR